MLKNKSEIKAILFDLDDTLLNSRKAQDNAIIQFKKSNNAFNTVDSTEFLKNWNYIMQEMYYKYLNSEISFMEMRIGRIKKIFSNYGIDISDDMAKGKFEEYLRIYKENWMLFDDTQDVLEKLKDRYTLCIVSNGDSRQQREKIEKTGLDKYFKSIIISGEVGYAKPRKEIFEIACKTIKIRPEKCIMVGDKFSVDIQGSINAGMQAIWVNRKKEKNGYEPKINELVEIIKILE